MEPVEEESYNSCEVQWYEHVVIEDYQPVHAREDLNFCHPAYELPNNLTASPETLCGLYWPDRVINKLVRCTNAYAKDHVSASKYCEIKEAKNTRPSRSIQDGVELLAKQNFR